MYNDGYIRASPTQIIYTQYIMTIMNVNVQYMVTNCYNYHGGSANNIENNPATF